MNSRLATLGAIIALACSGQAETWQTRHGGSFDGAVSEVHADHAVFESEGGRRFSVKFKELDPASLKRVLGSARGASKRTPSRTNNRGHAWPVGARHAGASQVRMIREDKDGQRFEYESPHYRFISTVRLNDSIQRNFSVLFETTYKYCRDLPLSLEKSDRGAGKATVYLFANEPQYVQAGGPPGSAGCYIQGKDIVLVPLSSLGVIWKSGGFTMDRSRQNMVLVHELVHQLTPPSYFQPGSRGWFSEGLAEYVATTPYQWGYFQCDASGRSARSYISGHGLNGKGGRALGKVIHAPSLERLLTMPYREFAGRNASVHYSVSLLCVHYFFHLEDQGRATRIGRFMQALDQGRSRDEALAALLDGRSYQQLEQEIAAAWKTRQIDLRFGR